jgi:hypothetical protein
MLVTDKMHSEMKNKFYFLGAGGCATKTVINNNRIRITLIFIIFIDINLHILLVFSVFIVKHPLRTRNP